MRVLVESATLLLYTLLPSFTSFLLFFFVVPLFYFIAAVGLLPTIVSCFSFLNKDFLPIICCSLVSGFCKANYNIFM